MAVYFLNLKTFGRSGGSSAVSAAAYRSGERIRDERTGRVYDHTDRRDVLHKEILLPDRLADVDMSWAMERAQLWNAAEGAESRKNARVAREYLVALPVELDPGRRLDLVRGFSRELVERYGFALDLAVHAPRDFPGSDPRNFHAHLLATTREVTPSGLAAKTTLELGDGRRNELGLPPAIHELLFVRERWAAVTNEALREAQVEARVDHRSLSAQGIAREPYPYIPRAAFEMERHGYRSGQAEWLRQQYALRVAAREAAAGAMAARTEPQVELRAQPELRPQPELRAQAELPAQPGVKLTLEQIRRQAREDWLRLRNESGAAARGAAGGEERAAADRAAQERIDDDHLAR